MGVYQSRVIDVEYKGHERKVPLEYDTYEALLDGFINTFKDVLPVSEEKAREMVRFQKYDSTDQGYVDIISPSESIAGISKVKAKFRVALQ